MAGTARAHGTQVVLQNSTSTSRPRTLWKSQSLPRTSLTTKFGVFGSTAGRRASGGSVTGGGGGTEAGGGRMAAVGGWFVGLPAMFSFRSGGAGGSSGGGSSGGGPAAA